MEWGPGSVVSIVGKKRLTGNYVVKRVVVWPNEARRTGGLAKWEKAKGSAASGEGGVYPKGECLAGTQHKQRLW